jgi:hypothetical protein
MEIVKQVNYTAEDLQKAYTIHFRVIYPMRSRLWLIFSLASVAAGSFFFVWSMFRYSEINYGGAFLILYGIILLILFNYRYRTMGKRMFKKMPEFSDTFHYVFHENGVRIASTNINSDLKWSHFTRCYAGSEVIMVYPNKFRFSFYMRRHFTDLEYDTLTYWVNSHIPSVYDV